MKPFFHVIIPVFNAAPWIARCIGSLREQEACTFRVVVVDDASTDATPGELRGAVDGDLRFTVRRNDVRCGALANIMSAIADAEPADEDVIVTLDGDDWLEHPRALVHVAELYERTGAWMTYGQARLLSTGALHPEGPYPDDVFVARSFRAATWRAVHLRTFKYGLWRHIMREDLLEPHTGKPWSMAWDCAIMFPMLEMCPPGRVQFGGDVLYIYNDMNPIGDNKVSANYQRCLELLIRAMPMYDVIGFFGDARPAVR